MNGRNAHASGNERVDPMDQVYSPSRRDVLCSGGALLGVGLSVTPALAESVGSADVASVSEPHASSLLSSQQLFGIFDRSLPERSNDRSRGLWSSVPGEGEHWLEMRWPEAVLIDRTEIFWAIDGYDLVLPVAARLAYWDGNAFRPIALKSELSLASDRMNSVEFDALRTSRLRVIATSAPRKSVGILRVRVKSAGPRPDLPPAVVAGVDRSVVVGGQTYLSGAVRSLDQRAESFARWRQVSGPGKVSFKDPTRKETSATFSKEGNYLLRLESGLGEKRSLSDLHVRAVAPPPPKRLDVVYTTPFSVTSPMWRQRYKSLITTWIPHCVEYCERTDLPTGQGGLDNFLEAAKALRGESHGGHKGYVFSNAWVHQTVEAMCLALMVEPLGDPEIERAQAKLKLSLERWIPIILAAQEKDGYLQTAYTLADRAKWPSRWNANNRADHEGYVAGYFIESAINHFTLTDGRDRRLYNAARKLADCWVANIGPGKKAWFDGHQEMEQALVRFGRFVNDVEGGQQGSRYIALARFLLDSRQGGAEYDQSHLPPVKQYEAVGHAVRAVYFYSGMADIAAETGDTDYQSAVVSLWDNMVNRKYYVTGGVGSGDSSEGFGVNYSLKNDAYCESCSSCGLIFFQYKMNIAYHDAKYADLVEETLYNALWGSIDQSGQAFCYTNPLITTDRAKWHSCPCCVANIPRTLLMMPTWTYTKSDNAIFVNLFVGGKVKIGSVSGVDVELIQETNYPWEEKVRIRVNSKKAVQMALNIRVPNRKTSELYHSEPELSGLKAVRVNGREAAGSLNSGYLVIERLWEPGDYVDFDIPLAVQRVTSIDRVDATRGRQAFRFGPVIYAFEGSDLAERDLPLQADLKPRWRPELFGGVVTLEGMSASGKYVEAIPYFARANRSVGRPEFPMSDGQVNYAPGTEEGQGTGGQSRDFKLAISRVWMKA